MTSGSQDSIGMTQRDPNESSGGFDCFPRLDRQPQAFLGPDTANGHGHHAPYQQTVPYEMPEYPEGQILQPTMDFPMNWLPPDPSLAIDYDSIVGLGVGSLDFFSLPSLSIDGSSIQDDVQQDFTMVQPEVEQNRHRDTVQGTAHLPPASRSMIWNNVSPEAAESHVSSASPYSAAHTISPSEAPGGLYATSINGARMPCTIRARRANHLLPGARPLQRLDELQNESLYGRSQDLSFPDTSHVMVEEAIDTMNGSTYAAPLLARSTYADMLQGFSKLCIDNSCSFVPYSSARFPDISSLNLCIRLYFDTFDTVMPIFHDQVTQINDHWMLALAVSAIGCQYAEADEYAQMVEPLHEFLRRAIMVANNTETTVPVTQHHRHQVAFAQARLLNQVGMLYSGSPRLLQFAKAQHSGMIELARSMMFPKTSTTLSSDDGRDHSDSVWTKWLLDECKRRIGYSIWVCFLF